MSTGTIIALSIVVLSILMLLAVGMFTYSEIKPTFRNLNELNTVINQKKKFYTREAEELTHRITLLNEDTEYIQQEVQEKKVQFQDLAHEQGQFQSSVRYLQDHAGDYSKGIAENITSEIKEDGPKVMKSFKLAFKKTIEKQKIRFKNR